MRKLILLLTICAWPLAQAAPVAADPRVLDDRLTRLEAHLQNQGLFNLLRQQEELRAEIARLRGAVEEYAHAISLIEQRQKTLYQDSDARIKTLEAGLKPGLDHLDRQLNKRMDEMEARFVPKTSVQLKPADALAASLSGGAAPVDTAQEERAYSAAQDMVKKGDYTAGVKAFDAFVKAYPAGRWTGNALYWSGFAYFAQSEHDKAVAVLQRLISSQPSHAKVADATLTLARSRAQLKDIEGARKLLDELIERHPKSKAASLARKFRATLD